MAVKKPLVNYSGSTKELQSSDTLVENTMAANTFKANNTSGTATPADVTVKQALALLGYFGRNFAMQANSQNILNFY